jgi:GntR family transcriptional repressor for pyruvate dehydrogenase complex
VAKSTAGDRVVRKVLELVQSGRLGPGDRLPPENDLVRRLKVSRPSVREGLRTLAAMNLVESRHGQGTFVKELSSDAVIRRELVPILMMSEALHEIQDTRRVLEGEIAARSTARATPEDLQGLEDLLGRIAAAATHRKDIYALTWKFHNTLAEMSGNRVMARVLAILQDMIGEAQITLYNPHISAQEEIRGHRTLLKAIRGKDPEHARRVMMEHLDEVDEIVARTVAKAKARRDSANATRSRARSAAAR